ncbi:hypothetical protein [Nostoc sp.]|uniref:hypothetical protein n=1 Tax=Nostoc sp. TaxID=1180 RepID=UPI002FFC26D2
MPKASTQPIIFLQHFSLATLLHILLSNDFGKFTNLLKQHPKLLGVDQTGDSGTNYCNISHESIVPSYWLLVIGYYQRTKLLLMTAES